MIYEPAEDSYLLQKYVRKHAKGRVLDMGTGSGIQAVTAANNKAVREVVASDIQKKVITHCKRFLDNKKISCIVSDLFSKINKRKFDTVIFNPPYLPEDTREDKESAFATTGGKKGYELLQRFLNEVADYLSDDGVVLIVFSSLTKREKVDETIESNLLAFELLEKTKIPFEELYCYKITKKELLQQLHGKKIANIHYFNKGKRGIIYTGLYKKKKVAIKTVRKGASTKMGAVADEVRWLTRLNKQDIGPKFLFSCDDYLVYEFVEGEIIKKFIEHATKKQLITVLKKLFDKCVQLDKLQISKEEMHHPYRHVIVNYPKITLLDFERTHIDLQPNTVTQFLEYIMRLRNELQKRGVVIDKKHIQQIAKEYKKTYDDKALKKEINKLLR